MSSFDIFKSYDIRGKVGEELNVNFCQRVGEVFGAWLPKEGKVAVGYDMRPDSQELAGAVISGLTSAGRDVVDIGMVSSDMIYFAVGHLGLAGGAMVTASHNPGEYNGIKLCREEAMAVGEDTGLFEIRDRVLGEASYETADRTGTIEHQDVKEDWVDHVLSFVDVDTWPAYNIAIDAGNGMLGAIAPTFTAKTPLQVVEMFYELDGSFPNHPANPIESDNLTDVIEKIRSESLDFGVAFDGDGDRAVMIDETGKPISGTIMTALLAKHFLEQAPGSTILYNAIVGRVVPELVKDKGGEAIRTRVGHSHIKAAMRKHDAVFGGEHASHFFFRDNWSADSGLLAIAIAIDVLAKSGKKLSELVEKFDIHHAIQETNFSITDKKAAMQAVADAMNDGEQDWLDGLTVNYVDGWVNVRPSNTEPLLRLNAEATNPKLLEELTGVVKEILRPFIDK